VARAAVAGCRVRGAGTGRDSHPDKGTAGLMAIRARHAGHRVVVHYCAGESRKVRRRMTAFARSTPGGDMSTWQPGGGDPVVALRTPPSNSLMIEDRA